jgi:hypothetical protein
MATKKDEAEGQKAQQQAGDDRGSLAQQRANERSERGGGEALGDDERRAEMEKKQEAVDAGEAARHTPVGQPSGDDAGPHHLDPAPKPGESIDRDHQLVQGDVGTVEPEYMGTTVKPLEKHWEQDEAFRREQERRPVTDKHHAHS